MLSARRSRHAERGQTLPVWVMGVVGTLGIMFFALNYGNAVRMQLRAQNAADAAAQNLLSIQTQRWNLMLEMLYASNVEEYRLRRLLDGTLLSITDSGQCQISQVDINLGLDHFADGQCAESYNQLRTAFEKSVNRYSQDVKLLNDVTAESTDTNWLKDANAMLTYMQNNCNQVAVSAAAYQPAGGDCAFTYHIAATKPVTGLTDVEDDAYGDLVPGLGRVASNKKLDDENTQIFQPYQLEVTACALIPPLIPNLGPLHAQPYYAVARSAAQTVQFVQDWLQPGQIIDPAIAGGVTNFQPNEIWQSQLPGVTPTPNPWYDVNFGGNAAIATSYNGSPFFAEPFYGPEMSARLGWWNAVPIKPFATTVTVKSACP